MPTVKGRAMQVPAAGGAFQLVEKEFPEPGPGHVRIRVHACGVCHSDSLTKEGQWPGVQFPRVPGHEIAGVVDAVGPDVPLFKPGSASASAGMAATATTAIRAAAATSSSARTSPSAGSATTAATRTT